VFYKTDDDDGRRCAMKINPCPNCIKNPVVTLILSEDGEPRVDGYAIKCPHCRDIYIYKKGELPDIKEVVKEWNEFVKETVRRYDRRFGFGMFY
jgi:thiol-disulfide isomerase/thioredoxin